MSQSIFRYTPDTLHHKLEESMLEEAEKYIYNRRFMLGEGVSEKRRNHAIASMSFICEGNCDILENLNKVFRGITMENRRSKNKIKPKKEYCHHCSDREREEEKGGYHEGCDDCMIWENKEW